MALPDALFPPLTNLLDRIIPDATQRNAAKLNLLSLHGTQDLHALQAQLAEVLGQTPDPWTTRARPCFLYVMYVMILCALPMGVLAAFQPGMASAIATGINSYLNGIPSPLYTLFGTGYIGYTAARQWGKKQGTDK